MMLLSSVFTAYTAKRNKSRLGGSKMSVSRKTRLDGSKMPVSRKS